MFSATSLFANTKLKTNIFTPPTKRKTNEKEKQIDTITIDSFEIQAVINIGKKQKLVLKILDKKLKNQLANKLDSKGFLILNKGSSIGEYIYLGNQKDAVLFDKNGKLIRMPLFLKTSKRLKAVKNQTVVAKKNIITDRNNSNGRKPRITHKPKNSLPHMKRPISRIKTTKRNTGTKSTKKIVAPKTTTKSATSFVEIFKKAAEQNNTNQGSNPFMNLFK
jgi:hypothetical protein